MTIPGLFRETVSRGPGRRAIEFEGAVYRWSDLDAGSNLAALALRSLGVGKGDRVCLYAGNSIEFVLAYLGTLRLGAVAVPANPAYREAELGWILADAEPTVVVCERSGLAVAAKSPPSSVRTLLAIERGEGDAPGSGPGVVPFREAMGRPGEGRIGEKIEESDLAAIAYTSGTTGRSKGAMLSHGNFASSVRGLLSAWEWTSADRFVHALPLFHVHGLGVGLHGAIASGCESVLLPKFEAAEVLALLSGRGGTLFMGVPTMYERLLGVSPRPSLPSMRLFVSGSAPLSVSTFTRFREAFGHEILERYGMTETLMNVSNPLRGPRRPGTVGVPLPGVAVRLVDPNGRDAPDGGEGEILLRGPNVFQGYWRNEAATREAFVDGWFRTGDLGRRDPSDGTLSIVGRAKELIITGGLNVYPREVEEVLASHPDVAEVAVVGVPDAEFGEAVAAAVVLKAGGKRDAQALVELCRERLASFKKPRRIEFVEALPRNAMGKVQKNLLRERFAKPRP